MSPNQPIAIVEEELVARLRLQDNAAVTQLYDMYSAALFGVILRIVKDNELAEDVLQECFVKIWSSITSYDSTKGKLFTWLINIARNLAIDKIRSRQYRVSSKTQGLEKSQVQYTADVNSFRPEYIGLKELTAKLNPDQKKVIDMMYFDGFTQSEVAEELNIPLGTVKTRARAAIKALGKFLK
ncbi:sigma-70 family RNA polymerase sigma factor [Adhaeribacter swui]|uniref:Sigma-70 family RNA polymerase sigma factor n=1 Tax=Adhaeribacter swui TaxID=2086471 RepID=A0A7G7GDY0_9BACT|nr:sigma-70 family RNA polymerase sigma factor [Adhaeribacter swui]QNF35364.1 sigma-70 family RNA polymerase sigma factor [Adhaeribacter swui]